MVANYLIVLRDFPIQDLLAATNIDQVSSAIRTIFGHLKKIKTATQYPLARSFQMAEAISRDLKSQILKILSAQHWIRYRSQYLMVQIAMS